MDINDIGGTNMDGWDKTTIEMANGPQDGAISKEDYSMDKEGFLQPTTYRGTYPSRTCKSRKLSFPDLSTGGNLE